MYSTSYTAAPERPSGWFRRTEAWLDDRGKPAWIAAMILGFVLFWPLGLAILAYMIWSKRMFNRSACHGRHARGWQEMSRQRDQMFSAMRPSGNAAFDAYKAETLRRLEEEQEAFETFLQRLREAKDKQEFDAFMDDRARAARATPPAAPQGDAPAPGAY